jgi:putative peptide zinc metalloprotease protein
MPSPSAFLSATNRSLTLRLRPDLVASQVEMSGAPTWVIKDPLTLEHYHFSPEEFALLELLRQPTSLAALKRAYGRCFAPRTITDQEVWTFLSRLHESGLITSDAPGQGDELLRRGRTARLRRWATSLVQLTAIQFRGINPDRFLTAVHNCCRWLFSGAALAAAVLLILYAVTLVVGHWAEFRDRLPELSVFVDMRNWLWLIAAIAGVKILHEFGHALACKHFGGEIHELGIMLLVFVPCLYCDVSDSWQLASKWKRILVSAAGILVELVIAAIATIICWHADPNSLLALIALDVMVICTVHTLAVNGNPLLRYDGYYILADLVESPNLWQRSRDAFHSFAGRWLLGLPADDDTLVPECHRSALTVYAVVSRLYIGFVVVAIVWGLACFLYPWHLENLALALGATIAGTMAAAPAMAAVRLIRHPSRRNEVHRGRVATIAAAVLVAAVVILAWPVNYYVRAPLVLLPEDAARVYATEAGALATALSPGVHVDAGQTIAKLDNADAELELARLAGDYQLQKLRLTDLELLRGDDTDANAKLPATKAAVDDLARQLADRQRDAERLTIVAPTSGTVIPVPRLESAEPASGRLRTWTGAILDPQNRGALIEPGTLLCFVGDPNRAAAILVVDDTNIERLRPGQQARLRVDQLPGQVLTGEVVDVARRDPQPADSEKVARADLAPLFAGILPPGREATHFQVRVRLENPPAALALGGRGQAKIAAERITLARWIMRYLAQTFRLPA